MQHCMMSEDTWFGEVYGNFCLWAFMDLMEEESDVLRSFSRSVIVFQRTPSMELLRKMDRTDEVTRLPENSIEITSFYEFMCKYDT